MDKGRKQGKIIRLNTYRQERRAQSERLESHRRHQGFLFAEQALQIMLEEAGRSGERDITAVWYATARMALRHLRLRGFSQAEIERMIKELP